MNTFTVLPFLVAMAIGIARMPTNVYQVCAWNVGTVETEPWRSKAAGAVKRAVAGLVDRVRAALGHPSWRVAFAAIALAAILTDMTSPGTDVLLAAPVCVAAPLKELRQKKVDIHNELKELNAKAAAAATGGGPALTDDERAKVKTLKAQYDEVSELLIEAERLNDQERTMPAAQDPDAQAASRATTRAGIVQIHDRAEDDPMRGFKSPREFILSVMKAGRGRRTDARLEPLRVKPSSMEAAAGSDEQSGLEGQFGAFLVPHGISPTILQLQPEDDPLASRVTPVPMTNPIVSFNARVDKNHSTSVSGGLTVSRRKETAAGTSSRIEFEQVTLRANSLFGLAYATEEILVDSPASFAAIIAAGFRDQFSSHKLNERINGKGNGEPLGAMESGSLVTVSKETGQAAKTIVTENIEKMRARCWRYSRAIWIANHDTIPQLLALVRAVGTGGQVVSYYKPAEREGEVDTLLGRPIFFTEYAQTLGTKGDVLLGVWSEYLEGTYQPLESAESIHVRFVEHERAMKFWLRDDGAPWWKEALTPKNGTNTLSPFVTLAARA